MQYLVEGNDLALFQFKGGGRLEIGRLVAAKVQAGWKTVLGDGEGVGAQRQQYLAVAHPVEGLLLAVGQRDGDASTSARTPQEEMGRIRCRSRMLRIASDRDFLSLDDGVPACGWVGCWAVMSGAASLSAGAWARASGLKDNAISGGRIRGDSRRGLYFFMVLFLQRSA